MFKHFSAVLAWCFANPERCKICLLRLQLKAVLPKDDSTKATSYKHEKPYTGHIFMVSLVSKGAKASPVVKFE